MYFIPMLQKELQILRNTFFRTRKQVLSSIVTGVLLVMALSGLSALFFTWFNSLKEKVAPDFQTLLFTPLIIIILVWVTVFVFLAAMEGSRKKFFQTTDLSLLISTPVPIGFLFVFRFLFFVLFSGSILAQLFLFGFAPLVGLGIAAAAPWYYYVLLLPVTYLYLLVPAVVAVTLIVLLLRVISPRGLFHLAAGLSLFMSFIWICFLFVDQEAVLLQLVEWVGSFAPVLEYILPLAATGEILGFLIGLQTSLTPALLKLAVSFVLIFVFAFAVIGSTYNYAYDRLQSLGNVEQKKPVRRVKSKERNPGNKIMLLVYNNWRIVSRNYEMAQGAIGILTLLIGYGFIVYALGFDGGIILQLFNIGVIGLLTLTMVEVFFLPTQALADLKAVKMQYWVLKATPLWGRDVIMGRWLTNMAFSLPLAGVFLFLVNAIMGLDFSLFLWSLPGLWLLMAASGVVFIIWELLDMLPGLQEYPLPRRILHRLVPYLYYLLILLLGGLSFYYSRVKFLSFMHQLPVKAIYIFSGISVALLTGGVCLYCLKKANHLWDYIEI